MHGLGQTPDMWGPVIDRMDGICLCPDLPAMIRGTEASYENLYRAFETYCDEHREPLDMCGLSLGGILALNYAIDHEEHVNSLVLIAAQYRMPKGLLRFQNAVFRLMPTSKFQQMGFDKDGFLQLCKSMMTLDFSESLYEITCPVLLVCGENDATNRKASEEIAEMLPTARLQVIKGAGHEVNTEAPERLAETINEFYRNMI